jgi:hypothetical protein
VFVPIKGSSYSRFRRALELGRLPSAYAERSRIDVRDALEILGQIAEQDRSATARGRPLDRALRPGARRRPHGEAAPGGRRRQVAPGAPGAGLLHAVPLRRRSPPQHDRLVMDRSRDPPG